MLKQPQPRGVYDGAQAGALVGASLHPFDERGHLLARHGPAMAVPRHLQLMVRKHRDVIEAPQRLLRQGGQDGKPPAALLAGRGTQRGTAAGPDGGGEARGGVGVL